MRWFIWQSDVLKRCDLFDFNNFVFKGNKYLRRLRDSRKQKSHFSYTYILKERDVTYLPSHFHHIHFIYQSSSIHFMYPTHSFHHSFLYHSFYRSQFISFTFTIFDFAHTASYFNHIVPFIYLTNPSLETRSIFR